MKNTDIQFVLAGIAEDAIPSAEIDLWQGLSRHLETSESRSKQGDASMKTNSFRLPVLQRVALVVVAIVAAFVLLLITPSGQAWAQRLFQFFSITENRSFPIPTQQIMPAMETQTPAPTFVLPVEPVELTDTPMQEPISGLDGHACTSPEDQAGYFCQVKAAEALAGFNAKELPVDPKGLKFSQAIFDPARSVVEMEFMAVGEGGYVYLQQGLGELLLNTDWDRVPPDAVEKVSINGVYAELMHGAFVVLPGASEAIWEPRMSMWTLRWRDGQHWFSLVKSGDPYPIEWLDDAELIKLAESLVDARALDTDIPINPEYLESIQQVESLSGFDVLTPGFLPQGFELEQVGLVWDNTVRLAYTQGNAAGLYIFEMPLNATAGMANTCMDCPPEALETVQVGPWTGQYWRGIFRDVSPATDIATPTREWDGNARDWTLTWTTDKLSMMIIYSVYDDSFGGELDKEALIKIAENMK